MSTRVLWITGLAFALVAGSIAVPSVRADDELVAYVAVLAGGNEVPSTNSLARGLAHFELSADGTTITYRLIVANIRNVIASHIHVAAAGVNGPVVVFLYGPVAPGGGPITGVIATGSFTAANLVGPLAGHPLSDLIAAMNAGNAYVNVHTNDGVDPINTGPGDFPGGEIRGQIMLAD